MIRRRASMFPALAVCITVFVCSSARAGMLSESGFAPRVPVSAFASPGLLGLDMSRFHVMNTVSFGTGWNGRSSALNVTSLSYQFRAPLTMSVSVGNTFGTRFSNDPSARGASSNFFLEGFDLAWQPNKNSILRIEMHDVRSPLQYGRSGYGHGFGTVDPFSAGY